MPVRASSPASQLPQGLHEVGAGLPAIGLQSSPRALPLHPRHLDVVLMHPPVQGRPRYPQSNVPKTPDSFRVCYCLGDPGAALRPIATQGRSYRRSRNPWAGAACRSGLVSRKGRNAPPGPYPFIRGISMWCSCTRRYKVARDIPRARAASAGFQRWRISASSSNCRAGQDMLLSAKATTSPRTSCGRSCTCTRPPSLTAQA